VYLFRTIQFVNIYIWGSVNAVSQQRADRFLQIALWQMACACLPVCLSVCTYYVVPLT